MQGCNLYIVSSASQYKVEAALFWTSPRWLSSLPSSLMLSHANLWRKLIPAIVPHDLKCHMLHVGFYQTPRISSWAVCLHFCRPKYLTLPASLLRSYWLVFSIGKVSGDNVCCKLIKAEVEWIQTTTVADQLVTGFFIWRLTSESHWEHGGYKHIQQVINSSSNEQQHPRYFPSRAAVIALDDVLAWKHSWYSFYPSALHLPPLYTFAKKKKLKDTSMLKVLIEEVNYRNVRCHLHNF